MIRIASALKRIRVRWAPQNADGTEIIDNSSGTMLSSHGEGECSFYISGMPGRGILEAEVNYGEESTPDFKKISEFLCQNCLNKVAEMYEEEMDWSDGEGRFPEVCLVDFATKPPCPHTWHHHK